MNQSAPSQELMKQPNIGKVLAERLIEVEIDTIEKLKLIGTEKAFIRLRALDQGACINELYALEGAIRGIRWHDLPIERKEQLRYFFRSLN